MSRSDTKSFLLFAEELPLLTLKPSLVPDLPLSHVMDGHAVAVAGISNHYNESSISMKPSTASDIQKF